MASRRPRFQLAALAPVLLAGCSDAQAPTLLRIAFVTVVPVATTLAPGDTLTFSAFPRDSTGQSIGVRPVSWTTSSPDVVRIDSTGFAHAIEPGTATITATIDGVQGEATIVVVAPSITMPFVFISAGGHHTCAIGSPSVVLCWGRNKDGQIGDGTFLTPVQPTPVPIDGSVVEIVTGARHTCALGETGNVACWGWNASGQAGTHVGQDKRLTEPTPIDATGPFTMLAAGNAHNCALTAAGAATCWGSNEVGQLGTASAIGGTSTAHGPFVDIDAGHAHTCAVTGSGETWCWGWNAFHQLGANAVVTQCAQNVPCSLEPQPLTGLPSVISVRAGFAFTCALATDGGTWCWGLGVDGQLGTGARTSSAVPIAVVGGHRFTGVDAGAAHACGITAAGDAWCWGSNRSGQLGDGTRIDRVEPIRVTVVDRPVTQLSAGESHTCALFRDGQIGCWGSAGDGRLGPFAR